MSPTPKILVLSGDRALRDDLVSWRLGLVSSDHPQPSLVVLDLDDGEAPSLLRDTLRAHPEVPVLVTSQDSTPERIVEAMRAGAHDWLARPLGESARRRLEAALWHHRLSEQGRHMQKFLKHQAAEVEDDRRRLTQRIATMTEELQAAHTQLQGRVSQLVMLYRIGRELSAHRNWDASLSAFLVRLCEFLQAEGAALLLLSQEGTRLAPRCVHGLPDERVAATCETLQHEAPRGTDVGPALFVRDEAEAASVWRPSGERDHAWSETVIPLQHRDQGLGYLVLAKAYDPARVEEDLYFLITIQTILSEEVAGAQAWSALHRLQRFQARTLDHVGSGVLTVGAEGEVLYANTKARALVGDAPDALALRLAVGAEHLSLARWLAAVPENGVSVGEGWLRETEDVIPVGLRASRLRGEMPGEYHYVLILEDERTLRDLEAERRRAARQDELLIMAAEWAHDVRTPLTGILHSAELLSDALPADSRKRRHFQVIRGEVERIDNLVSNFLDFARPPQLKKGPTDLGRLATDTVTLMKAKAAARGVELSTVLDEGDLIANVDRSQLKQVLLNLLTNAVEASSEHMQVHLRVQREALPTELSAALAYGGAVALEVEDQGPGVSANHLDRLFVPFFTTKPEGSGLGLAISEKVVRAHLGHLRYERRGDRTVMRAILPVATSAGTTTPDGTESSSLQARG